MKSHETKTLEFFDNSIAHLQKAKQEYLDNLPLSSKLKKDDWVIDSRTNSHYQFDRNEVFDILHLVRHDGRKTVSSDVINEHFVKATPEQVESHLRFLNKKGLWYSGLLKSVPADSIGHGYAKEQVKRAAKVQLPEFYMITVEGKSGSVVRHPDFETAVIEATRLAKKCNHRAHIMSVCAIIEPVQVQKPITEYQLIEK